MGLSAGLPLVPQLTGGVPRGYLCLLFFNSDSGLVAQRTVQLSQQANTGYETLRTGLVPVQQDGYVTIYVGNESPVDVYFDDIAIEHRPGLQVQEVQYDPAGLELAGLTPPLPGIRGLNNYRFNGQEFQMDLGLNWNHQDWRFLDPTILHWNGVDPELENGQESWGPYCFGYDNAVRFADANGRAPEGGGGPGTLLPAPSTAAALWEEGANMTESLLGSPAAPVAGAALVGTAVLAGLVWLVEQSAPYGGGRPVYMTGMPNGPGPGYSYAASNSTNQNSKTQPAPKTAEQKLAEREAKLNKKDRAGKDFTEAGKETVKERDSFNNGGKNKCAKCGVETQPGKQHKAGQTPPGNETHVDHINPKSNGGRGNPDNGQVLCRDCNLDKGAKVPQPQP